MAHKKYPNLEAEMKRFGVTQQDLANDCSCRIETISNWMIGKSGDFSIGDAITITNRHFPGCDVKYLFQVNPEPAA